MNALIDDVRPRVPIITSFDDVNRLFWEGRPDIMTLLADWHVAHRAYLDGEPGTNAEEVWAAKRRCLDAVAKSGQGFDVTEALKRPLDDEIFEPQRAFA